MRTVHETEALRPSDPIPKGMQPSNRNSRLKQIAKAREATPNAQHETNGITNGNAAPDWTDPGELGFTEGEETRGYKELWQLLRRQVHWAEEEGELLKRQCEAMEELRKNEWLEKEVLLDQVIRNEVDWHDRRKEVLAGLANLPSAEEIKAAALALSPQGSTRSPNPPPVKGQPVAQDRDAAAVLASLHQG
jgi:hypothetical protein